MYNNLSHLHGAISFNQTLITHLYVSRCANMPPSLWCAFRFPFLSCNSCRDSFPVCLQHPATVTSGLTLHSVPFPPETGSCCVPGPEREHWGLLSFVTKEGSANSPGAGSQGGPVIRTGIVCVCVCVYTELLFALGFWFIYPHPLLLLLQRVLKSFQKPEVMHMCSHWRAKLSSGSLLSSTETRLDQERPLYLRYHKLSGRIKLYT